MTQNYGYSIKQNPSARETINSGDDADNESDDEEQEQDDQNLCDRLDAKEQELKTKKMAWLQTKLNVISSNKMLLNYWICHQKGYKNLVKQL